MTARLVISLMKWQFDITHTIQRAEILAVLDIQVTNTLSVKMLCPKKKTACCYIFLKNFTCLSVGLLRVCEVFSVSCKTV